MGEKNKEDTKLDGSERKANIGGDEGGVYMLKTHKIKFLKNLFENNGVNYLIFFYYPYLPIYFLSEGQAESDMKFVHHGLLNMFKNLKFVCVYSPKMLKSLTCFSL